MGLKEKQLEKVQKSILTCKFCLNRVKGILVPGEGSANSKIMLVGEAPGKNESITGKPFIGRAGKLLRDLLEQIQISDKDIFITSAVKYLPQTYITPKPEDIEHGKIHLQQQIKVISPKVIVILGAVSAMTLLNQKVNMANDHGKIILHDGVQYFLSYHPAAPLYSPKLRPVILKDFKKLKKLISKI